MSTVTRSIHNILTGSTLRLGAILIALTIALAWGWTAFASLDAPADPNDPSSQSYTLADVCNQLQDGTAPTIATSFTEPESAPDQDMCSLNDIYGLTPQPDSTNAAQSADVLDTKTFWALNPTGQWGLTTGTVAEFAALALLAATGQNTCYDADGNVITCAGTGQDGEYQLGATADPRFTDNSDGTVTDNLTGLIWLQNANCFGTRAWETALTDSNTLASGSCGLSDGSVAGDWRLPNVRELASLIDYQTDPAPRIPTGHPFTSVQSSNYWSSTSYRSNLGGAWRVRFSTGVILLTDKTSGYYVWPVR